MEKKYKRLEKKLIISFLKICINYFEFIQCFRCKKIKPALENRHFSVLLPSLPTGPSVEFPL